MLLTPGTRLGPYEILAPIDAGGMGEVWEARDTWRTRVRQDRDGIRAEVARLAVKEETLHRILVDNPRGDFSPFFRSERGRHRRGDNGRKIGSVQWEKSFAD